MMRKRLKLYRYKRVPNQEYSNQILAVNIRPFGASQERAYFLHHTRVGTLIVATIYLQLIQNRYMFRSFTALQCNHQHCVQPVASDVEVVGYI